MADIGLSAHSTFLWVPIKLQERSTVPHFPWIFKDKVIAKTRKAGAAGNLGALVTTHLKQMVQNLSSTVQDSVMWLTVNQSSRKC